MAWRPGPPPSSELGCFDYDEKDPWTQRFICQTDEGGLSLDVDAMNGLETTAGAIFVDIIRQQAERPPSTSDSTWSSWTLGQATGRHQHHPQAMKAEPPMAQYEPFRYTYVSDPTCVPQLRFANVPDTGANHHEREDKHHWSRAGRTWSRLPRFRKGETAFTHDPNHKPTHAVVDKWYNTEAGIKNTLADRVQESRWQSCHAMQSGREPREPTRSRLPREPEGARPGPASYHFRDPWEVKEVCGTVPTSRMFCKPVHRLQPRAPTSALPLDSCDMSVDTSLTTPTAHDSAAVGREHCRAQSAVVSSADRGGVAVPRGLDSLHPFESNLSRMRHSQAGGSVGGSRARDTYRHRRGRPPASAATAAAVATAAGVAYPSMVSIRAKLPRARTPAAGALSFARAERSSIADECRRKEESYGKRVVRLLTGSGDVVVTVNRRRTSVWGNEDRVDLCHGRRSSAAGKGAAGAGARSDGVRAHRGAPGSGRMSAGQSERRGNPKRAGGSSFGRRNSAGGGGGGSALSASTITKPRGLQTLGKRGSPENSTLEAQAIRLLPGDLAAKLPAYRQPGRAELPPFFRATSAPMTRAAGSATYHYGPGTMLKRGMMTNPDGFDDPPQAGVMAKHVGVIIKKAAGGAVQKRNAGSAELPVAGGGRAGSPPAITAVFPAGGAQPERFPPQETVGGSYGVDSTVLLSGGETLASTNRDLE